MGVTARLYELQAVDLEIAAKTQGLQDVEGRLGESEALRAARTARVEAQEALKAAEVRRRALEVEIEDINSHLSPVEKKLYGGTVRNPKELLDLQGEVSQFKSMIGQREDVLLQTFEAVEQAQRRLQESQAAWDETEKAWQVEQESLRQQQGTLQTELAALQAQRSERSALVDAASLSTYEWLRDTKQGRAVAPVARGICQACRVSLSLAEVQRARGGQAIVTCSSCGRILHVA